jgi:hypothetical protein
MREASLRRPGLRPWTPLGRAQTHLFKEVQGKGRGALGLAGRLRSPPSFALNPLN